KIFILIYYLLILFFKLIYYLLILFFKSENIFKETMGAYPPPSGSARTSRRHCTYFFLSMCLTSRKEEEK
ncbi:hypothetical protein KP732_05355, partial [Lactococcus lactis]|uniref:hypothetical protein n=1 Tax=Lactococcus lactis TaxID=1358 RepID=UPI001C0AE737